MPRYIVVETGEQTMPGIVASFGRCPYKNAVTFSKDGCAVDDAVVDPYHYKRQILTVPPRR